MRRTPLECQCKSCECGIYTYNESSICVTCETGNHLAGGKRVDKNSPPKEQTV